MITARCVAASRHPAGPTLYTLVLRFPTFILPEVLTHRDRARNTSSTRATPTKKLLDQEPYVPSLFRANRKGMQPGAPIAAQDEARRVWLEAVEACRTAARKLSELGVHKQWAGRPLMWFGWTSMCMTSVHWQHFLALRDHPDAQDEIQELARCVRAALESAEPRSLGYGEWHLPFAEGVGPEHALAVSVARCARVSYYSHASGAESTVEEDLALFERLLAAGHWSPFEHQATPDEPGDEEAPWIWKHADQHGPLTGWRQYRKQFAKEYRPC